MAIIKVRVKRVYKVDEKFAGGGGKGEREANDKNEIDKGIAVVTHVLVRNNRDGGRRLKYYCHEGLCLHIIV